MNGIASVRMGNTKKVCIILVNYNTARDTLECIRSLQKIDYPNYRIIVVDNASAESLDAIETLAEDNKIVLLRSTDNIGFAGGNNLGIRYAMEKEKADYIVLLNNDTVVKPDFLSVLVNEAERDPSAGILTGTILRFDTPDEIWYKGGDANISRGLVKHWGYGKHNKDYPVERQYVTFATGCLWLLPRKTIQEVGLLTEDYFLYAEDTDYCCRVRKKGFKILFAPDAVIWHKVGRSSKVSQTMQYYMVRNDFCMFSRFSKERQRRAIECRLFILKMKDVLRGRLSIKALLMGYYDYKKNVLGKKEWKSYLRH